MEFVQRFDLSFFCLMIIAFLVAGTVNRIERRFINYRLFLSLLFSTSVMLVLDVVRWIAATGFGGQRRLMAVIATALYYILLPIPPLSFILFAEHYIFRNPSRLMRKATVFGILAVLSSAAVAINAAIAAGGISGWLFNIDPVGQYSRGELAWVFELFVIVLFLYPVGFVFANRAKVERRTILPLLFFSVPPILGWAGRWFVSGSCLLWPGMTISCLVIFLHLQNRKLSTDYLTGAYTRRRLDEYVEQKIRAVREGRSFSGILVDLDDFKRINDNFGHSAGDAALEDAAELLRSCVRDQDFVCRWAGDEFVVVLEMDDPAELAAIVDRIRERAAAFNEDGKKPYRLGFSIGAGIYDPDMDGFADRFIARLDAAMYCEKEAKKRSRGVESNA